MKAEKAEKAEKAARSSGAGKRLKIEPDERKLRLRKVAMEQIEEKAEYEKRLEALQLRMLRIQQATYHQKQRAVVVLEGWDAAGKGGAIRRMTSELDPRGFRVWPIGAPTPVEQGKHYLYRFWERLPEPGMFAIFDRSWYGRVLVERVEGLASRSEWKRAYAEINEFEHLLIADGVRLVKVFLHITPEEQLERFKERLSNPYKQWKIGESDLRNREMWPLYEEAIEDMFDRTSTRRARWHLIGGDFKWYGRVAVLEAVTKALAKGLDLAAPPVAAEFPPEAARRLGLSQAILPETNLGPVAAGAV